MLKDDMKAANESRDEMDSHAHLSIRLGRTRLPTQAHPAMGHRRRHRHRVSGRHVRCDPVVSAEKLRELNIVSVSDGMNTVLKFGRKDLLEKTRTEGYLYFNTVAHFREIDTDLFRGDPHEGSTRYWPGEYIEYLEVTLPDGRSHRFKAGQVHVAPDLVLRHNLYCLYGLGIESAYIDERLRQFGDHALFVFEPNEFFRRVDRAMDALNMNARRDLVRYVSRSLPSQGRDPFTKFDDYSYQSEYRILIKSGSGKPMKLDLGGSIADICEVVPFDELNRSIRFDVNLLPPQVPAVAHP